MSGVPNPNNLKSTEDLRQEVEHLSKQIDTCAQTIYAYNKQKWFVKVAKSPVWEKTFTELGTALIRKRQVINEVLQHYVVIFAADTLGTVKQTQDLVKETRDLYV